MRVFISWSGDDSKRAAELIKGWLPSVIQEVDPWISAHDIPKGGKWLENLTTTLASTTFGLLMVTKTNFTKPWLVFEAGALSNVPKSQVVPLLCDIGRLDIANTPLAQFQSVLVNKEELRALITEIAKQCSTPLSEKRVTEAFEKWWPEFEQKYNLINFAAAASIGEKGEAYRFTVVENVLQDVMKSIRRIEQIVAGPPGGLFTWTSPSEVGGGSGRLRDYVEALKPRLADLTPQQAEEITRLITGRLGMPPPTSLGMPPPTSKADRSTG